MTSKFSFISSSRLYFQAGVIICHSPSGFSAGQVALLAATCCASLSLAPKPSNAFNKSFLSSCLQEFWGFSDKLHSKVMIKMTPPKCIDKWFYIWNDFLEVALMSSNSPFGLINKLTTALRFAGALPITRAAPPPVVARTSMWDMGKNS